MNKKELKSPSTTIIFHYFNFTSPTLITRSPMGLYGPQSTHDPSNRKASSSGMQREVLMTSLQPNHEASRPVTRSLAFFFSSSIFREFGVYQAPTMSKMFSLSLARCWSDFTGEYRSGRSKSLHNIHPVPDMDYIDFLHLCELCCLAGFRIFFVYRKKSPLHMNRLALEHKLAPFFRHKWSRHPSNNFYYY